MPFKNIFYIQIFILISTLISATETSYMFDRISKDQGLSSNSVSAIQEDSRGFLWIATQSGLNFYDGYKFKVFNNDPFNENSLAHDLVQSLYIDDEDTIWAGTYNGVSKLNILTSNFVNYKYNIDDENSISSPVVTEMQKDMDGQLWIATLGGLNRLNPETGKITRYMHDELNPTSLMNDVVRSVLVDSKNRVWVGNLSGVDLYNPETDDFTHFPYIEGVTNGLPGPYVMKIIEGKEDELYIGIWGGGVSRFNINTGVYTHFQTPDNRIYTLTFDKNGLLWAGSWGGGLSVIDVNVGLIQHLTNDDIIDTGISSDTIYSLFEDSTGILWVGTNGGGLNKLNYQKQDYTFLTHNSKNENGLSSGKVDVIFQDSKGLIWIGVYNGGLDIYNPETKTIQHHKHDDNDPNSISSNIISDIYEDSLGRILLTTNGSLEIYNPETDNFSRFSNKFIKENNITEAYTRIIEDKDNNIWLGTYFNGLLKMDLNLSNITHYNNLSDKLIRNITQRNNGEIWIGTNLGLNRYNPITDNFDKFLLDKNNPKGVNNNNIRTIIEDEYNTLWLGSSGGGIMQYNDKDGSFTHYTTKDGLSSNYIVSMIEGADNKIWVGTKYGVSTLNILTKEIETITKEDGLNDMEFSEGALVDSNNKVYLGSFDAVSIFETSATEINKSSPITFITSVKLGNKYIPNITPHSNIKEIRITYAEARYITFDFVGINYLNPQKTKYSYKLEGFDKEWMKKDFRNQALYTNLSPGTYTLKVQAINNDGIWSNNTAELKIIIEPPYWLTWWAYLIYTLFIIIFIYLLVSLKENIDRKKRLVELEILNNKNVNLSITDPLTRIYNRRYLRQRFNSEIETAVMYGTPLTTIMIDIDDFKMYNDTYGHQAGDRCLISVVNAIKGVLNRPDDSFVRYGGEEFCIILPRTDLNGAKLISENIRKAVEETGAVTISVGVHSKVPEATDSSIKLIKSADEALYTAKRNGKNRVVIC